MPHHPPAPRQAQAQTLVQLLDRLHLVPVPVLVRSLDPDQTLTPALVHSLVREHHRVAAMGVTVAHRVQEDAVPVLLWLIEDDEILGTRCDEICLPVGPSNDVLYM